MKEKDITLLSGNDKDNYWNIFIRINENGDFNVLRGIRVRDKEDKLRHNKASREYSKKHKRKVQQKYIALLKGEEDDFVWTIYTSVSDNGTFQNKGGITITSKKERSEYMKSYHYPTRKQYSKRLFLNSIGEEGYTIVLTQNISKNGKVIGIGSFQMHETPEMAQVRRRKKKEEKLILLNEHFSNSDLHHLNAIYGIYIPTILHQSVNHDLKKNINMDKINKKSLEYWDLNNNISKKANCFK